MSLNPGLFARSIAAAALLAAPAFGWQGGERGTLVAPDSALVRSLDRLVASVDRESDITVAVSVQTLDGAQVYGHRDEQLMVLASNAKLVTTAAALLHFDPDYRWTTQVVLNEDVLWVGSDGDPSLRDLPGDAVPERFLDGLAAALEERGVSELSEIVLDDRAFDREFRHPLWPTDQSHRYYCAPVSALSLEGGCFRVLRQPGEAVAVLPAGGVRVRNELSLNKARRHLFDWRLQSDDVLVLSGNLAGGVDERYAPPDPLVVYQRWIRAGLAERGIACEPVRLAAADESAPEFAPVYVQRSAWTLADAVAVANLDSDNFVSEVLLKSLGRKLEGEGSFAAGVTAVKRVLEDAGLDPAVFELADGSGMARNSEMTANRGAPAALCELMALMATQEERGRIYFDSLRSATQAPRLRKFFTHSRFAPDRVRAKTGWITGASSLSGYLLVGDETDGSDQVLVYSVVVNYEKDGTSRTNNLRFRELQRDILAELIDGWPKT